MNKLYEDLPEEISVKGVDSIRVVTLNRPEALNATNMAMHTALSKVWRILTGDEDARAVILTGAGTAFSAGGDFDFMLQIQTNTPCREAVMEETRTVLYDMIRCPLPIIAAINGPAVGLGANLALSCDIVLMSESAHLADPHINIGLVAGDGGAALWPLYTSMLRAKEYIFTGEDIQPELAVQLGLANRVVKDDDLMNEALALANKLARKPTKALQDTKRAMNLHIQQAMAGPMESAIQAEIASLASQEHADIVARLLKRHKEPGTQNYE